MKSKRPLILFVAACTAVFGFLTRAAPLFAGSKEKVLYNFCTVSNCTDGAGPSAGLIFDANGNLYGTTVQGGAYGAGTVYRLTPGRNGRWTEKVLHTFGQGADGVSPWAGLTFDGAGNLYGTTTYGGTNYGGIAFQLTSHTDGSWTEKVLYNFCSMSNCRDGSGPGGLILDAAGNLYGTNNRGGIYDHGTVFKLSPGANGKWTVKVLYGSFRGGMDESGPDGGVIFDAAGNLYGTTFSGGIFDLGTVFQLTPGSHGRWTMKVLHSFGRGKDGIWPSASLISDSAGNLYSTTEWGGAYGDGTVFQLIPGADGKWTEKILHSFNGTDGSYLIGGLIVDATGNLYGTTFGGGVSCSGGYGCGTCFELSPGANGKWTEKLLHAFTKGNVSDGRNPYDRLVFDAAGNLYGTTSNGGGSGCGGYGCGTVFQITP